MLPLWTTRMPEKGLSTRSILLTRGHTLTNCPNKRRQQQNETHESGNQQPEDRCENWKRAQDQPQYSNPENKCLHCTGNHRSCDCPRKHQHQAPPATNPLAVQVHSLITLFLNFQTLHPNITPSKVSL